MMPAHLRRMARYNRWANGRLYDACARLAEDEYRKPRQAFFGSLHGTLNHMFVADVIWLSRFRDRPNPPWSLDHIPHDDPRELRARRDALDRDIIGFVGALTEARLEGEFEYLTISHPAKYRQKLAPMLAHFFNHQTHHRGQCHAMLTRLTGHAPSLDLIQFQRE